MTTNVYFTSDTHFGHANVIKYSKRPFANPQEMREQLIKRWNAVVKPGDVVYHLGDFALCAPDEARMIAARLHGQKYLVFGNHDKALRKDELFLQQWIWARDLTQVEPWGQKITLCHYAMKMWNQSHFGAWQLYGHSHGTMPDDRNSRQLDVGVDCWDYAPVSFEQVKEAMSKKTWKPVDHHGTH